MADAPKPVDPDEFERWLQPRAAITLLAGQGLPRDYAIISISKFVIDDELAAVSRKMTSRKSGRPDEATPYWRIPRAKWEGSTAEHPISSFWTTGIIEFRIHNRAGPDAYLSCIDVRFDPQGINKLVPVTPPKVTQAAPAPSNRGRRPREIWEPMWAEIAAQAFRGELSASKLRDIEEAMNGYFLLDPKAPAESSVRLRAQRLLEAIQRKADK